MPYTNAHTVFNMIVLLGFFPFAGQFAVRVRRLIPRRWRNRYSPRGSGCTASLTPLSSLGTRLKKEVLHMAEIINVYMFSNVMMALRHGAPRAFADLEQKGKHH